MNKRIFFVLVLGVALVLGMVLLSYASYKPLPKVRIGQGQPSPQKLIPGGGKSAWRLWPVY